MPCRHLYLVRELPEEHDGSSTFAKPRYAGEVLSAQYAIARSVLDIVLRKEASAPNFVDNNNNHYHSHHNQQQQQQPSSTSGQQQKHPHFVSASKTMHRTETSPL